MKWFEPIIIIVAILLVVLPFAHEIKKTIKGKTSCSCGCKECSKKGKCLANFKSFVSSYKNGDLKN